MYVSRSPGHQSMVQSSGFHIPTLCCGGVHTALEPRVSGYRCEMISCLVELIKVGVKSFNRGVGCSLVVRVNTCVRGYGILQSSSAAHPTVRNL